MTRKQELLESLREYVASRKNVRHAYIKHVDGETRYCAVGFLLHREGMSDLDLGTLGWSIEDLAKPYYESLLDVGFTKNELLWLQDRNDNYVSRWYLLSYIDQLLAKERIDSAEKSE